MDKDAEALDLLTQIGKAIVAEHGPMLTLCWVVTRIMGDKDGGDILPVHPEWDKENYAMVQRANALIEEWIVTP